MIDELKELCPQQKGKGKGTPKSGGENHHKGKGKKNRFKKIKGQVAAIIEYHLLNDTKTKEKEEGETQLNLQPIEMPISLWLQ